jgi:FKBP-type peptidyl-prolyl cis-trans isomerase
MNMTQLTRTSVFAATLAVSCNLLAADAPALETTKDKVSYAVGLNVGRNLKANGFEIDTATLARGLADAMGGGATSLSDEEARSILMAYQSELREKQQAKLKEGSRANREAGAAFLAENAKKEGVKSYEVTLPDGSKHSFQYKVLKQGDGELPKDNHQVTVNYRGTLIDGTEFDSSYKRGEPASFGVTGVIKGWTEALKLMPVGSKWQLFIPADLAYGDQQRGGQIQPGSTLIFEVEVLATKGPEPIVSDIIKVPSAEEMKKGAKIETIKAEDVEKLKKEAGGK